MKRRDFIKWAGVAGVSGFIPLSQQCKNPDVTPIIKTPDFQRGHQLLRGGIPSPQTYYTKDVVIIGGGVAGLSAARYLKKQQIDFELLELESEAGGNSRAGKHPLSAFPLGAHYLPVPDASNTDLIEFMQECGLITSMKFGKPVYDDRYLCHIPKERLYIQGYWQDGIVPEHGISNQDKIQFEKFRNLVLEYRNSRGQDGKWGFDIPIDRSSQDKKFLNLDTLTFRQFLTEHQLTSESLLWYLNYCCLDDFGTNLDETSAWGGMHYFCSRRSEGVGIDDDDVLTWPEGNNWLVQNLFDSGSEQIRNHALVYDVVADKDYFRVRYLDILKNHSIEIKTSKVILATPTFITNRISKNLVPDSYKNIIYNPWVTGNLVTSGSLNEHAGKSLSWDNVIYGSGSLGYVYAQHQTSSYTPQEKVITWYQPVASSKRKELMTASPSFWLKEVVNDLSNAHPRISDSIQHAEFWIWGHGMASPVPGLQQFALHQAQPVKGIEVAHSDHRGISIFEEAFHLGLKAARNCL